MGNVLSEEEQEAQAGEFLEEGFNLDSPDADREINFGTSAPNCQPKHTKEKLEGDSDDEMIGHEVSAEETNGGDGNDQHASHKHRRQSSMSSHDSNGGSERRKRQHLSESQAKQKLSYIQMAKLGYQELVNAIIRPPRADYKVSAESENRFLTILFTSGLQGILGTLEHMRCIS